MAKSKIILDLIQEQTPLSQITMRLKTLLFELSNNKILDWLDNEIEGYNKENTIPLYRKLTGCVQGDILTGFTLYRNVLIPTNYSDEHIPEILSSYCKESLCAIEQIINNNSGNLVSVIPSDSYQYLDKYINGHLQNAKLVFSTHDFVNIYSHIKNKVLSILLFLEQKFGNLDSYDIAFTDNNRQEVIPIILQIIYSDNSITIGDKNKLQNSEILTRDPKQE